MERIQAAVADQGALLSINHPMLNLGAACMGCGWQAEAQLAAVANERPLEDVRVYSRSAERREAFAQRMSRLLGLEIVPVASAGEAARDADVVVTITSSRKPVLDGQELAPGSLVCAAGSNWLEKAELDVATFRRAGRVICDSIEACRIEAGDFVEPLEQGALRWEDCAELAQVVTGDVQRADGDQLTVFKSVGLALEDVAVGAFLLKRAKELQMGRTLPLQ